MSKWWEEEVAACCTLQSLKVEWAGVPRLIRALDFFRAWLGSILAKPSSYCMTTILTTSSLYRNNASEQFESYIEKPVACRLL